MSDSRYTESQVTIQSQSLYTSAPTLCLCMSNLFAYAIEWRKTVSKSFNENNLQQMTKLTEYLAHLSRRLTGELIGYPWSGACPSTISSIISSETALPIKAKFYVEPPWEGGTKVYVNGPGHMTKMATTIYGKNL